MKILVVEDSDRLAKYLAKGLRQVGYAVDRSADGEDGLWRAQSFEYDVIVLDLMLPKLDGMSVLRRLRESESRAHVLILTAKDDVKDRVQGLTQGADDYLVKPFDLGELLARVQALVRRRYSVKSPLLRIGDLTLDMQKREVRRGGVSIDLRPREYALLEYFALRPGELVKRSEIEAHIYDETVEPKSNVVEAAVYSLRKKIDGSGLPPLIHTRRGMGYVLCAAEP
jgi:DNA-binding response OmpR family regulator